MSEWTALDYAIVIAACLLVFHYICRSAMSEQEHESEREQ